MPTVFQKKTTNSTDVEGMVTCGNCKFAKWDRWIWYCEHPTTKHEIEYGTVDKFRYCTCFEPSTSQEYSILVPIGPNEDDYR